MANPTYFPTLIGSELFEQQQTREGGSFAAQWRPNDQFELKLTGFYSGLNMSNYNYNYMFYGTSLFNNVAPTSYNVTNGYITSASFPLTSHPGVIADEIVRPNEQSSAGYLNLDGKYRVDDRLSFTGQIGYTKGGGHAQFAVLRSRRDGRGTYAPSGNGYAVVFAGRRQSAERGGPRERLGVERVLQLGRHGDLRPGRRRLLARRRDV